MITISLCMIVKDEEAIITRCLESVKECVDEIIIVDTGSTDRTVETVKQYTPHIYFWRWIDDFAAARNYSFSQATKEYILWLDADDVLLEQDKIKLLELKSRLTDEVDVVMMPYNLCRRDTGEIACSFPRERLIKRSKGFRWYEPVHEYLDFDGNILKTDIAVTHKSNHGKSTRNLKILEKLLEKEGELSHRNTFYFGRELFSNERYLEAILQYEKFLEKEEGLPSNYIDACLDLAYCYKIMEDSKNQRRALLRCFEYHSPRAEICCKLGDFYKEKEDYKQAIIWYKIALQLEKPPSNTISVIHDYWDYIPCMELSWCYYKIGELKKSYEYNEKGGQYKPYSPTYLHNKEIFDKIF